MPAEVTDLASKLGGEGVIDDDPSFEILSILRKLETLSVFYSQHSHCNRKSSCSKALKWRSALI